MATNDHELNNLLDKANKLTDRINLVPNSKTRSIYNNNNDNTNNNINNSIPDVFLDDSLNNVPQNMIHGVYYRQDIQNNNIDIAKNITNYDIPQEKIIRGDSQMKDFTNNSYAVPSIKDDANMVNITKRDDYHRNGPTRGFYEIRQDRKLFTEPNNNIPFHKEFFNNIKNNVIQDNNVNYNNELSNRTPFNLQNQFINKSPLYPNIDIKDPINEYITEHSLIIDSMDRDFNQDQNIFNFTIKFRPGDSATGAYFNMNLERIRYLRLDKLILPDCYVVLTTTTVGNLNLTAIPPDANTGTPVVGYLFGTSKEYRVVEFDNAADKYSFVDTINGYYYYVEWDGANNVYYYFDKSKKISEDRFTHLEISEITNSNEYSTNSTTRKSFGVLYPERVHNGFVYVNTTYSNIVYKFSNLKNLNRLSFKFSDSIGTALDSTSLEDTTVTTTKTDLGTINSPSTYMRHPLFKFKQIHMVFKVGVVELEHNKKIVA